MAGLFGRIAALFDETKTENTGHDPAAVAFAALMVRLARADGMFDPEERQRIEAALDARFGEGAAVLLAGEKAEAEALDNQQFTRLLKGAHAHEDRAALLEDLWRVVLADGVRDDHENALMRQIGSLLHVSDQDIALARRRIERAG